MSTVSVSIDRTSLSKAALVVSDDGAVYQFTKSGVGYVVHAIRTTTMPESADTDGIEVLAFAKDAASLPLEFFVKGATTAAVRAAVAEFEEALYRLTYAVTYTVDGVAVTYQGGPAALVPSRSSVDSGVVAAHFDTFSVTIPFPNPNGT